MDREKKSWKRIPPTLICEKAKDQSDFSFFAEKSAWNKRKERFMFEGTSMQISIALLPTDLRMKILYQALATYS